LFFAGDNGQRIFQSPFSWKQLGINIQGRSSTLRINYRTSQQIRKQADRLLPNEISDADGNTENRKRTISVFHGPNPQIELFDSMEEEISHVAQTIRQWRQDGIPSNQIGIFVRSSKEMERATMAVMQADEQYDKLDDDMQPSDEAIAIGTMHQAKGLEFRAVIVMACDEDVLPSLERLQTAGEKSDQDEIYNTERYLLYVAATRAREQLLITAMEPGSEFLEDLQL
jgi:superfamily I DNA/RNA helicase